MILSRFSILLHTRYNSYFFFHKSGIYLIFDFHDSQFRDIIVKQVREGTEEINIMKWMSRAALEYIGQGGLGYSFNALEENAPHNKYSDAIKLFRCVLILCP